MSINRVLIAVAVAGAFAAATNIVGAAETPAAKQPRASASLNAQDRGKYMLIVGGCNDCHTAGFAARGGDVPEREWLKGGGNLGFKRPMGYDLRVQSSSRPGENDRSTVGPIRERTEDASADALVST
jgi:hypothetical protein